MVDLKETRTVSTWEKNLVFSFFRQCKTSLLVFTGVRQNDLIVIKFYNQIRSKEIRSRPKNQTMIDLNPKGFSSGLCPKLTFIIYTLDQGPLWVFPQPFTLSLPLCRLLLPKGSDTGDDRCPRVRRPLKTPITSCTESQQGGLPVPSTP